jgi:hypothetical protein
MAKHARIDVEHLFSLGYSDPMVRGDRSRIYAAQRTGIRNRMHLAWRMPEAKVEALIVEWEAEAKRRGLRPLDHEFWMQAEVWLAARRT